MNFYEYSAKYSPPIPVCELFLGAAGRESTLGPLEAIIDTGVDITVVPMRYLHQVGARRISGGRARSLWGDARDVNVYAISLKLNGLQFAALQVLADDLGDEIVVGRAVLNRLKIVLDGPAMMTEIIFNGL